MKKENRGKEEMKEKEYSLLQNISFVLKSLWKFNKLILLFMVLNIISGVLLPALGIYMPKLVIDQITAAINPLHLIGAIGGLSLLMAAANVVSCYSNAYILKSTFQHRTIYLFQMLYKMMDCDYSFMESAEGQTKVQKALNANFNDNKGLSLIVKTIAPTLTNILGFFLYSSVLSTLNPIIMLVLTLTSVLHYFVLKYIADYIHKNKDNWTPIDKKIEYIKTKSSDFASAKDIRLYNMKAWFINNYEHFVGDRIFWIRKMDKKEYLGTLFNAIIILIRDGFAYLYLIFAVTNGKISISEFVLFFGAIAGFSSFVTGIISNVNSLNRASLEINDVRGFLDIKDSKTGDTPINFKTPISIEFKNISFRYSTDSEYILKDFNLNIKQGEKLAIVGANGAGKTTLVKLLCGFYKPESGEILLDGKNIQNYKRDDIYTLFSAVFQDILILPVTVGKNISASDSYDTKKVKKSLELAGLSKRLPDLEAMLLKVREEDGIELSGGEQQKLILARALYKGAPILLLDEPTAALDPIAESELYMKYNELAKNKTSIFISHRLASTHFCDRVAFIENGKVAELGKHDELMANNAGYANMFNIQSHYYKKEVTSNA